MLVELLRTSDLWVRGSPRAMERPELIPRLAAELIAIAARMRATRNWRIHRKDRRYGEITLGGGFG